MFCLHLEKHRIRPRNMHNKGDTFSLKILRQPPHLHPENRFILSGILTIRTASLCNSSRKMPYVAVYFST